MFHSLHLPRSVRLTVPFTALATKSPAFDVVSDSGWELVRAS